MLLIIILKFCKLSLSLLLPLPLPLPPPLPHLDDEELLHNYGATADTTRANTAYLQQFYDYRLISQHFNPEWPASFPDLTPLDFSIFRWLKNNVYKQRLQKVEELMHEITHCCEDINEVMLQNIFVRIHTLSIYPVGMH
jgi:hypothetical protein